MLETAAAMMVMVVMTALTVAWRDDKGKKKVGEAMVVGSQK